MSIDYSDEVGWPAEQTETYRTPIRKARYLTTKARQRKAMLATNRVRAVKEAERV
jgi:hypothetical protein